MANGNREALDDRIAFLRRQVSDLTELAAAASGTARQTCQAGALEQASETAR